MNVQDIPTLPIAAHMSQQVKQLRENAPHYIKSVIEKTYALREIGSLKELGQGALSPLSGGMLSVAYWLSFDDEDRVIKLRYRGVAAEAKSLEAWSKQGASIVKVYSRGVIPETRGKEDPIKYLILEGVTDAKGHPAPTCYDYVESHPGSAKKLGDVLGCELAKMHRAKTQRTFGEFADMWGKNNSPYKTWNSYLDGFVMSHYDYLLTLGLTESKLKRLRKKIAEKHFPKQGVFVHGDYGLRNALLISQNPIKVVIFDPNPLIGNPSWDLAISYNNYEFERRKHDYAPRKKAYKVSFERDRDFLEGLIYGYEKEAKRKIDEEAVALSQLMQCTFLLQIEENKAHKKKVDPNKEIEVMVRKDTIFDKVEKLVY